MTKKIAASPNGQLFFDSCFWNPERGPHKGTVVYPEEMPSDALSKGKQPGMTLLVCVYANPEKGQSFILDVQAHPGELSKAEKQAYIQLSTELFIKDKNLPVKSVLLNNWYDVEPILKIVEAHNKHFYLPLPDDKYVRLVSEQQQRRLPLKKLPWSMRDLTKGKRADVRFSDQERRLLLFNLPVREGTLWFATNDFSAKSLNKRVDNVLHRVGIEASRETILETILDYVNKQLAVERNESVSVVPEEAMHEAGA